MEIVTNAKNPVLHMKSPAPADPEGDVRQKGAAIRLYSYRFRIECTFRELKQKVGAFCYHFWSKHMPKLCYYLKKGEPTPLEQVEDGHARQKILEAVCTIEMHMALSCIAMGILQSLTIRFIG